MPPSLGENHLHAIEFLMRSLQRQLTSRQKILSRQRHMATSTIRQMQNFILTSLLVSSDKMLGRIPIIALFTYGFIVILIP